VTYHLERGERTLVIALVTGPKKPPQNAKCGGPVVGPMSGENVMGAAVDDAMVAGRQSRPIPPSLRPAYALRCVNDVFTAATT